MRERTCTTEAVNDALLEDDGLTGDSAAASGRQKAKGKPRGTRKKQRVSVIRGMYEVADTWEKIYMLAAPAVCVAVFFQADLGVPIKLRGLLFLAVACYLGSCFLFLVVIDRRYAQRQHHRGRGARAAKLDILNEQRAARQDAIEARRSRRERDLAAQQRGAVRAGASVADAAAEDQQPAAADSGAASAASRPVMANDR